MTDEQVFNLIHLIASQHRCSICNVDFETHVLEIDGSLEDMIDCAEALDEVLEKYKFGGGHFAQ